MLIKCDECGKQVSDKAFACPSCGAPIIKNTDSSSTLYNQQKVYVEKTSKEIKKKNAIGAFFITIGMLISISGFFTNSTVGGVIVITLAAICFLIGTVIGIKASFKKWWDYD